MTSQPMMERDMQRNFRYLFERLNEPLGMGMKGPKESMVYYNMPQGMMTEFPSGTSVRSDTMGIGAAERVDVKAPSQMPTEMLRKVGSMCPRNGLFGYFIPEHRQALLEMRKLFLDQKSVQDLFSMACACRDSRMVHPHLFVNALSSTLASRKDCKGFEMPAFHEIMPDLFVADNAIKQAEKMARVKDPDKSVIMLDRNQTGDHKDPESRLWYFREDVGVNSHHFHWHVVFPGEWPTNMKRDRRGELFYYMHHSMIARYDAERLCNGLARTKLFNFDEPFLEEGYFGKLYSTNAGHHWGSRQAGTKLRDLARFDAQNNTFWDVRVEDLKKWRDRILEAIDSGYIFRKTTNGDVRERLDEFTGIDILGDIIENSSTNTPHAQYYGAFGFHNMGHNVISFSHDPLGTHRENFGPMGDTSTAMRDPLFYRWHKYIDHMFIQYKNTMEPYQLTTGSWPLIWEGIIIDNIEVVTKANPQGPKNMLTTHWAQRDINLARGLDFWRNSADNLGPVWARVTFLDYSEFVYNIQVTNRKRSNVGITVRIFLAPTMDEHGVEFPMDEQRNLYYEMDKFTHTLQPGSNTIMRQSVDSAVTVKAENLFHQLENLDRDARRNDLNPDSFRNVDPACGCGWPQHLLLTRGTPAGMPFDLFVIITEGAVDKTKNRPEHACRDAMSFCGIIDEEFPDKRPMGYPFDRRIYNGPANSPVRTIRDYSRNIPNSRTTRIIIKHDPSSPKLKDNGSGSGGMKMVDATGNVLSQADASAAHRPQQINHTTGSDRGPVVFPNQQQDLGRPWAPPSRVPSNNQQWGGPQRFPHPRGNGRSDRDDSSESWGKVEDEDDYMN